MALFAALARWIALVLAQWLPRMLSGLFFAFGVQWAVNNFVMPDVIALISSKMSGLPQVVLQVLTMLQVQSAITIVVSAIGFKLGSRVFLRKVASS